METETEVLQRKLDTAVKHYNFLLSQKDKTHAEELSNLEAIYKGTWKWKIGNLLVESFIRCYNFVKNPVRFFVNLEYRGTWNGYNSQAGMVHFPPPESDLPPTKMPATAISLPTAPESIVEPPVTAKKNGTDHAEPKKHVPVKRVDEKPVIATILDEISAKALQPELSLVTFRPDNWHSIIGKQTPEALLVESAKRGNQGSWQYKIGKTAGFMEDELTDLLNWSKESKIPSLFWFTCNPLSEGNFYDKAKLFDYILASNTGNIPEYQKKFGNDKVLPFPFAIQPRIHNPVSSENRNHHVCFPGRIFSSLHQEHDRQLKILLDPAMKYGLHIWDPDSGENLDVSGQPGYFESYLPFVRGRLAYTDMLKAFHRYKIVMNTSEAGASVPPVSRRVFESLACGTPVISTYSKTMHEVFDDLVLFTESAPDTQRHIDLLLNDPLAWMKASVRGIRNVMEFHRYDLRLHEVLEQTGITTVSASLPDICLLINACDLKNLDALAKQIVQQTFQPKAIVLLTENGVDQALLDKFSSIAPTRIHTLVYYQNKLSRLIYESTKCDYYVIWDAENMYGPEYLKDYALATLYSSAACFGKNNYYSCNNGQLTEQNEGKQYRFCSNVLTATLMLHHNQLSSLNFLKLMDHVSVYDSFTPDILALDPLNFIHKVPGSSECGERPAMTVFG